MLDRRLLPALAISITPAMLATAWAGLAGRPDGWMGTFEWSVTLGLLALGIATAIAVGARVRWLGIAIPAVLLAANTVVVVAMLLGRPLIPTHGFASDKYALALSSGMVLAIGGLVLRRQWARWLALALGVTGIGCGVLNTLNFWSDCAVTELGLEWQPSAAAQANDACHSTWLHLVTSFGGAMIVVCLVATRDAFTGSATWNRTDPLIRWLRAGVVVTFVAVPMLLVYAWLQPLVPETATPALVLAATLSLGATLAIRGKLAGALLLVAGGLGLAVQTLVTLMWAESARVVVYYAVFWTPAAVIATVCGALMIRPMLRLLRA